MKSDNDVLGITYGEFKDLEHIIDLLLDKSKSIEHEDYESVTFYGNGEIMLSVIKKLLTLDKYCHLRIGYIEVAASWFDENANDEYVLEISNDDVVSIQPAWNGDILFSNESKFTVCMINCSKEIFDNVILNDAALVIAGLSTKK